MVGALTTFAVTGVLGIAKLRKELLRFFDYCRRRARWGPCAALTRFLWPGGRTSGRADNLREQILNPRNIKEIRNEAVVHPLIVASGLQCPLTYGLTQDHADRERAAAG